MPLTALNIGYRPAPAARKPMGEPDRMEYGTTGTGIFGQGYIRELGEYDSEFQGGPFTFYRTCEKMRRGCAAVAFSLGAMKTPVRCAEWAVVPPKHATAKEKECAKFVEANLFDDLDFDRSLENMLLAVDFGAACHEDVWTVINGRVRLAKLAPRMPLTFYTWTLDGNENLLELVQHGFHGGTFAEYRLRADKIALYSFRQEGANFAGRPILREMYQHWYTLNALYKIDSIACERNGMGVPVGTLAKDAKKEDRALLETFLSRVAAHQSAYVMLPHEYVFKLQGVEGQVRDCKESIQHHLQMISTSAMCAFLLMGQSSRGSGNRSLGETMSDFFFLSLQSLANQIGDAYSDSSIARLVFHNYGAAVRPPRLVPQRIIAMKFESITDAMNKLGLAGLLTPDPDMELWVRQQMGAPVMDRAELVRMQQAVISTGAKGRGGARAGAPKGAAEAPGTPAGAGPGEDASGAGKAQAAGKDKIAASEADGVKVRRPPVGAEKCMALSEIVSALDKGRDDVAAALRAARPRVQAEIVHKAMNRPVGEMHRASVAPDEKLVAEVTEILHGIHDFGRQQVANERAKQRAGAPPPDAAKIRAAGKPEDRIGLYADGVVGQFTNTLSARATNAAINRKRKGGTDGEVIQAVQGDLDEQSDKWIDGVASEGANEAFAAGRESGFEQFRGEIARYIYSALLDINTCESCAAADGREGESEDDVPQTPNPDCDGGDKCRCVLVAVFGDEGEKAA